MNARTLGCSRSLAILGLLLSGVALHAQFNLNKLKDGLNKLNQAADKAKDRTKELTQIAKGVAGIGPEEERAIGGSVALEIVAAHGGLVRDAAIIRRVNLLGRALAQYSTRPELDWRFGVLASETINAFSAPGGYVFLTRGLYELAAQDDALAAILAHEIAHITRKHALGIVARGEFLSGATTMVKRQSSDARKLETELRNFDVGIGDIVKTVLEKGFDPKTEFEADREGRALAIVTGYAPGGLRAVLVQLQARSKTSGATKIFSTHPPIADRLNNLPPDSK
jgi:predicted Zn-dependent protease